LIRKPGANRPVGALVLSPGAYNEKTGLFDHVSVDQPSQ
jgi:hypothetical protein